MDIGTELMEKVRAQYLAMIERREAVLARAISEHGGDVSEYQMCTCATGVEGCLKWLDRHGMQWEFIAWLPDFKPSATMLARQRTNGRT